MERLKPIPIHSVITHWAPDLDACCADWLPRQYGHRFFPGIEKAKYVFVDAGTTHYNGRNADQLEAEGSLMIDVGGGRGDHHGRTETDCATTLMAKLLGIERRPELQRLLRYVRANDLSGAGATSDLADRIATRHRLGYDILETIRYAHAEFSFIVESERKLYLPALADYEKAQKVTFELNGQELRLAIVQSDSSLLGRVFGERKDAAVLIQRMSTGQVSVLRLNDKREIVPYLDMRCVAALIRLAEAGKRGIKIDPAAHKLRLTSDGTIDEVPEWYYFEKMGGIFNGGPKSPGTDPTRVHIDDIADLVIRGLKMAVELADKLPRKGAA